MYCNKESVNTLTALLVAHGVHYAVVCPGSRNAPIVHNLSQCPAISCYPITDERSAGFFALGIAQATDEPVVACVTSGTALLNLAPAVAEAHYQHQSLIVISADRPQQWIGQLDGQTMQQPGALHKWVACTVSLPEDDHWYCNRLVNEALLETTADHRPCVHINVPLTEPLFCFDVRQLPEERIISRFTPPTDRAYLPQPLIDDLLAAQRPLIIFGQLSSRRFHYEGVDFLFSHVIVLHEALAPFTSVSHFEESGLLDQPSMLPDFILYVGDAIVSKRLKAFLRQARSARTWRVSPTGQVEDTFQNLSGIIVADPELLLQSLDRKLSKVGRLAGADYRRQWLTGLQEGKKTVVTQRLDYSEAMAVREFEQRLKNLQAGYEVHYANSTAIRLANSFADGHPVWCNRGVNGIDGSLSTAVGFAAAVPASQLVFCVIGDLSFFYDQNALWNRNLRGNLRILLLNNGRGVIFDHLPGLEQSPVHHSMVAGEHHTTAQGICDQNAVTYVCAHDEAELHAGLDLLMAPVSQRPCLLEVLVS